MQYIITELIATDVTITISIDGFIKTDKFIDDGFIIDGLSIHR